ncbi:hypothetical protein KY314_03250 [Candidatus Woesearchaeota archaeon]|nr:hypothetical protein [Candidatus Woesearchaeota archaeon]
MYPEVIGTIIFLIGAWLLTSENSSDPAKRARAYIVKGVGTTIITITTTINQSLWIIPSLVLTVFYARGIWNCYREDLRKK